jgi:hypothetical protein
MVRQGFIESWPHRSFSEEFHPFLDRVVGEVAVEKVKAVVRTGRPAYCKAILPIQNVATR